MKIFKHTFQGSLSEGLDHLSSYPVVIREDTRFYNTYRITLKDTDRKTPSCFYRSIGLTNKMMASYFVSLIVSTKKQDHFEIFIEVKDLRFLLILFLFLPVCILAQIGLLLQPVVIFPLQIFMTCFNILFVLFSIRLIYMLIPRLKLFMKIIKEFGGKFERR